jgi:outer membrane protein TolC
MKNKFLINSILLIALLTSVQTKGQVSVNNELKELVQSSFTHFPKIRETENAILIAKDRIRQVELNKRPDITVDASYSYIKPKIELPINGDKFQFAPVNNFNTALNGSYTLLDFGRIKAAIEQAKNELSFSEHNKENLQHQIAYQTANIYYYIVYLKKAIAIQDTILNTLNENKKILESQFNNGTALEIDLLSIQSTMDGEENKKTELVSLMHKQEILLEYISGASSTKGNLFEINLTTLADTNKLELNPELIMLKDRLMQSKQDVSISELRNRPIVGLRASMGSRNGYIPNISDLRFNYLAGLSLSVPLYNGGKFKQQVKIQQRLADQQDLYIESMKQTLNKDIKQSLTDLKSAEERLKRTSSQIDMAQAASKLASNKLKHGTGTHLELTAANTNLQRSLLNQLQMEYQVCNARLEIARLTGARFW